MAMGLSVKVEATELELLFSILLPVYCIGIKPTNFKMEFGLLSNHPISTWEETGISQLQNSCNYLIENKRFEGWLKSR